MHPLHISELLCFLCLGFLWILRKMAELMALPPEDVSLIQPLLTSLTH